MPPPPRGGVPAPAWGGGGEDDKKTFTNYIAAYPNAGEKGCDGNFPKLLLKLLFSTVARDDAGTLLAVLGDVRVQAIPKTNGSYGGHHYGGLRFGGPSYWDLGSVHLRILPITDAARGKQASRTTRIYSALKSKLG